MGTFLKRVPTLVSSNAVLFFVLTAIVSARFFRLLAGLGLGEVGGEVGIYMGAFLKCVPTLVSPNAALFSWFFVLTSIVSAELFSLSLQAGLGLGEVGGEVGIHTGAFFQCFFDVDPFKFTLFSVFSIIVSKDLSSNAAVGSVGTFIECFSTGLIVFLSFSLASLHSKDSEGLTCFSSTAPNSDGRISLSKCLSSQSFSLVVSCGASFPSLNCSVLNETLANGFGCWVNISFGVSFKFFSRA